MERDTGMTKEQRASVSGGLAKLLADMYVLYIKTQNFHYNIHGPEFYSLHILTEKFYTEMAESIDEVAERIRTLGFFVEATMESCLKLTSITEDNQVHPKLKMIEDLIKAVEIVIKEGRKVSDIAEKNHDAATLDLIGRTVGFYEKADWMLRSQI